MPTIIESSIDQEQITGAFALAVDVNFTDLAAGTSQNVFEYSDANGDNIISFGQVGDSTDIEFVIQQNGNTYRIVAEDAIIEGEYATWRVGVDPDGTMRIAKNLDLLIEGQGEIPTDVPREQLIGTSKDLSDSDLTGNIINLKTANYGNVDELDPAFQGSPCATTGEVRCFCDKLLPEGLARPGVEGETKFSSVDLEGDGEWSQVQSLGVIAIHAVVLPDGKVFSFGTDENGTQGGQFVYSLYDPETGVDIVLPNTTGTDIFCSTLSLDPVTGNVVIFGGDARGEGGKTNNAVNDVVVFDYKTQTIRDAEQGEMQYDRWYGTSVTLANGEILVLGGKGGAEDKPEVFNSETGWRELTGTDIDVGYWYPKLWSASDGTAITFSGKNIYRIWTDGTGRSEKVGTVDFNHKKDSPGIMYDVDKIVIVGGDEKLYTADLSADTIEFTEVGETLTGRFDGGMSVLPDGRVIITGGGSSDKLSGATYEIEIWDPKTNEIEILDGPELARLYHSSHILLPNGTVWVGGGGAPGPLVNTNVEFYAPAYLYGEDGKEAERPVIQDAPSNIDNNDTFQITVDDTSDIARITAIRNGALTHAVNSDARFVELEFEIIDATTINVKSIGAGAMVPGSWMLFVLDEDGVPSTASMLGVAMAELVETDNLIPADTGLEVYGIDDDEIDGAFEIIVEARYDDISGGEYQRVYDFGNGAQKDNIVLTQVGNSDDMMFLTYVDGKRYAITAKDAIDEGVTTKWTTSIDSSGYMRLYKDDELIAEGQGAVPENVERNSNLVGESNWSSNDRLDGMVRNLEIINEGDLPEYIHIGTPKIRLEAPENVAEGDDGDANTAVFKIILDQPAPSVITADINITGNASGPAQIIIPAGSIEAEIEITITGDNKFELNENVSVTLTNLSQARGDAASLTASVTVLDDDAAGNYLTAKYFSTNEVDSLSDIDFSAEPDFVELVTEINQNVGNGRFFENGPSDRFAALYEGGFIAEDAGTYTFNLTSDDGSALYINGALVIDHDGPHGNSEKSGTIDLDAGAHTIEVRYFERRGDAAIDLDWSGPGFVRAQMMFDDQTPLPPPAPPTLLELAGNVEDYLVYDYGDDRFTAYNTATDTEYELTGIETVSLVDIDESYTIDVVRSVAIPAPGTPPVLSVLELSGQVEDYVVYESADGSFKVVNLTTEQEYPLEGIDEVTLTDIGETYSIDIVQSVALPDPVSPPAGPNIITGTDINDVLTGTDGEDQVIESTGNDIAVLGDGYDQYNLFGAVSDYTFERNEDGTISITKANGDVDIASGLDGVWFGEDQKWMTIEDALALSEEEVQPIIVAANDQFA